MINLNIWLAPDSANLGSTETDDGGGLTVFHAKPPGMGMFLMIQTPEVKRGVVYEKTKTGQPNIFGGTRSPRVYLTRLRVRVFSYTQSSQAVLQSIRDIDI